MALQQARGVQPLSFTNIERDALTVDQRPVGLIIYNKDFQQAEMWSGVSWIILGDQPGSLVFKGLIDATTQQPEPGAENGWMYINTASGTCGPGWTGVTGTNIDVDDRIIYDGAIWTAYSNSGDLFIPDLQQVTNQGSVTTNVITTGGLTTAGDVNAENTNIGDTVNVNNNITLDGTDGSARFAGVVTASGGLLSGPGAVGVNRGFDDDSAAFYVENSSGVVSRLNCDGSASFAGEVSSNNAFVSDRSSSTYWNFRGMLNGTQTSLITADGSATFASTIKSNGQITCNRFKCGSDTEQSNIVLAADGSAEFAGKVKSSQTAGTDSADTLVTKSYVDSTNAIPGNGALNIRVANQANSQSGAFTANQSGASTITIPQLAYGGLSGLPSIPAPANNGTITIVQPGTSNQSFTVNQSGNTTISLRNDNTQVDAYTKAESNSRYVPLNYSSLPTLP